MSSYYHAIMDDARVWGSVFAVDNVLIAVVAFRNGEMSKEGLQKRVDKVAERFPDLKEDLRGLPEKKDEEYLGKLDAILKGKRSSLLPEAKRASSELDKLYPRIW